MRPFAAVQGVGRGVRVALARIWMLAVLGALSLAHVAGAARADEPGDSLPRLRVVAESWYPYSYEEGGVVRGRATETVRKVLARAGFAYDIELYPWPRAYRMAQERENLLIYAMIRTPEREKTFQFVGQVMEGDRFYFFGMKGREHLKLQRAGEAKPFRIATSQDSAMLAFLEAEGFPNVYPVFDIQLAFRQLQYGRVDYVLTTAVNVAAHVRAGDLAPGTVVPYGWAFDAEPHMAFSPQTDPAVVARLREAYEALVQEGALPVFGSRPYCGMDVLTEGIDENCGGESDAAETLGNGGARGDR